MNVFQKSLLTALIAGSFTAVPVLAQQQEGAPTAPPAMEQQAMPTVSEGEIEAFAEAYTSVQQLNQEYTVKLQAAGDEATATELQQEAQEKMRDAISDAGLSLEQYRDIANAANQNMELQERLSVAIDQLMGDS